MHEQRAQPTQAAPVADCNFDEKSDLCEKYEYICFDQILETLTMLSTFFLCSSAIVYITFEPYVARTLYGVF